MAGADGRGKRGEDEDMALFEAERLYAASIFDTAMGDIEKAIEEVERALEFKPDYAPAILTLGSIEYQRDRKEKGRELFLSLLELPDHTPELSEILDEAGSFLIHAREYEDGLELFRAAIEKFPDVGALYQGLGCCAGNMGFYEEAIVAARRALEIDPENQVLVNDLGWSLYMAGRLSEAEAVLERACSMDPEDPRSRNNLQICREALAAGKDDARSS